MNIFVFISSLRSSIRRRYLWYFNRAYVEKMLAKRKGSCKDCGGYCCSHTRICRNLKNGKCSVYKTSIPFFCKVFPIDEKDIELACVKDKCKYYWK